LLRRSKTASSLLPLKVAAPFDWSGTATGAAGRPQEDEASSASEDEAAPSVKKPRKRDGDAAPASATEFEHLLVAKPNSSRLWIQYMHFHLDTSDIPKAREVAERALQTINYREEDEKLAVWVAILNLENTHGTTATREDAFANAVQSNEPLTVHLKMADILETSRKYGVRRLSSPRADR
jgi:rRNA biogenesis protein RRP5